MQAVSAATTGHSLHHSFIFLADMVSSNAILSTYSTLLSKNMQHHGQNSEWNIVMNIVYCILDSSMEDYVNASITHSSLEVSAHI